MYSLPFQLTGVFAFLTLAFLSCSTSMPEIKEEEMTMEKDTVVFLPRMTVGQVSGSLNEVSGIAPSLNHAGHFWVHNDSGDQPAIYCIDEKAQLVQTLKIDGANHRDWEDITTIKNPLNGKSTIVIADIGDNIAAYEYCTLYLFEEPVDLSTAEALSGKSQKITFQYADGKRDAETLLSDPLTGDLYIVSKRETNVGLYRIPFPYNTRDTLVLERSLTLPLTQIVGGDISFSGSDIALKNYFTVYYWKRNAQKSVIETLSSIPFLTSYIQEPQGEALCWKTDGSAFYTLSEEGPLKIKPTLYRYEKQK